MNRTSQPGDKRVTGPHRLGHISNEGLMWTKVWVYSEPGWREGYMRDEALRFVGCS